MPQFVLDHGSPAGVAVYASLDSFTQGYVEAMFWTEEEELQGATVSDLAPDALREIVKECLAFQHLNAEDLNAYLDAGRDLAHAGHDFWLTRNGHGTGFWDRDMGDLGERLSLAAEPYGEVYVCLGDDGLVHHD